MLLKNFFKTLPSSSADFGLRLIILCPGGVDCAQGEVGLGVADGLRVDASQRTVAGFTDQVVERYLAQDFGVGSSGVMKKLYEFGLNAADKVTTLNSYTATNVSATTGVYFVLVTSDNDAATLFEPAAVPAASADRIACVIGSMFDLLRQGQMRIRIVPWEMSPGKLYDNILNEQWKSQKKCRNYRSG